MYSILAVDPSFGGAYNVKKALTQLDETVLVCSHPDKWRQRPEETIDFFLGPEGNDPFAVAQAARAAQESRLVFLIGGSSLTVANLLPGHREWLPKLDTAVWYTDSYYRQDPKRVNRWMEQMDIKRYFVLPDGCYMAGLPEVPGGVIPLHHCVSVAGTVQKAEQLTIVHSPGTHIKRKQKQSDAIEAIVKGLQAIYGFRYQCLLRLPHAKARAIIRSAHIHIDKLAGYSSGLGKSGLEAMAGGAVELSAYYYLSEYAQYFPEPPTIKLTNPMSLKKGLERILRKPFEEVLEHGADCREWAADHWGLETGGWLEYFGRFVTL